MGTLAPLVVSVVIAIVIQSCIVYSQRATKSSLTFVIDDSQSMTDEIVQVRDSVDSIFDTVMSSNQSHIQNFVLVSFNDGTAHEPDYILHAVTEDRAVFKNAAAKVHIRDGVPECPERAMLGIKIGIKNSLPMSTLYVFTDASAKDYTMYDEIKAMAQRKQIQVTFLLTDDCDGRNDVKYQVYHRLAKATNGEVFNLKKKDIKDILKYVRENTKSRGNFIASKSFPAGYGFQFNFTVDSRTKEFTMSLAGLKPKLEIIAPNGDVAKTKPIVEKDEILIVKVTNTTPGLYKANVGSETGTLAKVTGQSDIHFEYGFSKLEPTSLSVTATRPEPDGKTYLSIQLFGDGVKLKTAKILDLKDKVLNELELRLLDAKTKLYTTEQFEPPKTTFRVFVYGYDDDNKMDLNRTDGKLNNVRDLHEKVEDVSPEVTIIEGNKIILDYDSTLLLTCKVHAHPRPEITWRDKDTKVIITKNVTEVAPPYDFISTLNIEKSNKNGTYECKAKNALGEKYSQVVVEANIYFKVLETPKNTTSIEYDKEGSVSCVVDANPPATTIWYKEGLPLSNDTNIVIASDNTTLTIKHMDLQSVGTYVCDVRNQLQRQVYHSEVGVFGLEKPVINKTEDEIIVIKGANTDLGCQITQGVPKPTIQWYYQSQADDSVQTLSETSGTLQLKLVTIDSKGKYTCNATNLVGSDTYTIELVVEYAPTIRTDGSNKIQREQGIVVTVPCDVDGVPPPTVKWFKNSSPLDTTEDIDITSNHSLKFHAIAVSDSGFYTCLAENQYGVAIGTVSVDVTAKPLIDKTNKKIIVTKGVDSQLTCRITQGAPKPTIQWYYQSQADDSVQTLSETSDTLQLKLVTVDNNGKYTCNATNLVGTDTYTIELVVEYGPTIKMDGSNEIQPEQGDAVTLHCDVDGVPPPTVKWFKKSNQLDSTEDIDITSNHSLKFHAIRISDSGLYTCLAENRYGSTNKTVSVDVTAKPIIEKTNKKILVTKGDDSQLACRITQGAPKPTIQWYYQPQAGDSVQTLSETSDTLHLKLVTVDSNGKYTCNATNLVGSDTYTIEVVVEYGPTIIMDGSNGIQPQQGDAVTIPCDVDGVPPPTVKWFKNSNRLDSTEDIDITSNHSLKFHAIAVSDSGLYTCQADNKHGSANKTVSVDVTAQPLIDKTNKKILATKGVDSQITCRITQGAPKPTIQWYYQSQANDSVQTLSETSDTLQLKLVTVDNNGKYTCNATNLVGTDIYTIELVVEYGSAIKMDGSKVIQPQQGDAVTIPCDVDGVPPPTVKWFKNSGPLDSTGDINITSNHSLKFHAIAVSDSGLYTCLAENKHGSANKTVSVDVTAQPLIDKTNKKILAIKGVDTQITCRITQGTPKPKIQWYYQSQAGDSVQTLSETSDTLHLKLVTVDSNGKYTCNATNLVGSDTYTIELIVEYGPTINMDDSNKIQPQLGDAVTIPCDVDGVPPPTVKWLKNSTPLVRTVDFDITSSYSLKFHAIELSDSALYTCQAENKHGCANKTVLVDVTAKPLIDKTNKKILVKKGDNSQLACRIIQGTPKPTIQWYYQSQADGSVQTLSETGDTLQLKLVTVSSNGKYTCNATNLVGTDTYTIELEVEFGPQIEPVTVTNITKVLDQRLELKCLVYGNPRPDIVWIHTDFHGETKPTKILYRDHGQYLFTRNARLTDEGYYTCVASNNRGSTNITYEVNVYAKPIILKTDYEKRVRKGENIQLSCRVSQGNPKPTIQWYFQSKDSKYLQNLNETSENLQLTSVTTDKSGTYQCNASNVEGFDLQITEFIVEYPPTIKDDVNKTIIANHSDILIIPCDVDGIPSPSVKWFKNGDQLKNTRQTAILGNHSLRIIAKSVSSIENYTCVAENRLGSSEKTVFVDVYVLPSIEVPLNTTIEKNVGEYLILPCRADGYPIPNITWIYYSVTGVKEEKLIKYDKSAMGLENIQVKDSGYYQCEARNDAGLSNLLYTVTVNAPPVIVDVYPEKTIKTVKGDLVLRLPCEVHGSPKPTITWKKDDSIVALGSSNYDIDNGTLIIKNTDKISEGNYVCVAENKVGKANVSYDVTVTDYPDLDTPVSKKFVEKGQNVNIACDIPHNNFDLVRWYKDGNLIKEGELTLNNAQQHENGVYSCRVSNSNKSSSAHVNITVGFKPYFTDDVKLYHKFVKDDIVILICSAEGSPTPKVSWWLNGDSLSETSMIYELTMDYDNKGNYTCEVSNELGNIQRSFTVAAEGCILDANNDFLNKSQPLMLSFSLTWPIFDVDDGYMKLKKNEKFKLYCPTGFNKFHTQYIEAWCENEANVKINGKVYKYAEIECKTEVEPTASIFSGRCLAGYNSTLLQVGYDVDGRFFKVYDVCVDNEDEVPLYTQHVINSAQYGVTKNVGKWFGHVMLPLDFDTMYDCATQVKMISTTSGKPFHPDDKCCFDKRQLVNTKDLRPGIPPGVAYSYLNVVPHWSTCNSKNWADVEQRVRDLAKSRENELTILTGTAKLSRIFSSVHSSETMLHDKRSKTQPVAQYLWKVVQDPGSKSSLAIIQVNVPDISSAEAGKYVLCKDICNNVGWMENSNWRNVTDGYTFCCSILDFERKFNYAGQFSGDMTTILSDWDNDGVDYS